MNKKTLIQIVIVVGCLGGSGIVLYNGLFKKPAAPPAGITTPGGGASGSSQLKGEETILPYGGDLDFDGVFEKYKFIYGEQEYPKLDIISDVGIDEAQLIKPLTQSGQ